jgi:hypothetical protein
MKYILPFLFFPIIAFAQENDKSIKKDFNNDGVVDRLNISDFSGSESSESSISVLNGKTKEKYEINHTYNFGEIESLIIIPNKLLNPKNKKFLELFKEYLLPSLKKRPDPSLEWIIDAHLGYSDLSDNSVFGFLFDKPFKWHTGKMIKPTNYYINIGGDTLDQLCLFRQDLPAYYKPNSSKGWLLYKGDWHFKGPRQMETRRTTKSTEIQNQTNDNDSFVIVDSSLMYKVYETSQGVLVKKSDAYGWAFVTDVNITGGPSKLRWGSIGTVKLLNNYLFILCKNEGGVSGSIFMVDITKGTCAKLKGIESVLSFKIENDNLIIESYSESRTVSLAQYFLELDKIRN